MNKAETTSNNELTETIEKEGMKVTWLRDNAEENLMPLSLFNNIPDSIITSLGIQNGIPSSISGFLVQTEGKNILFDTGNGDEDSRLLVNLEKAGLNADDIQYIYLTHLHGDHIGGMTYNGKAIFKNAEVYLSKAEYDAWINTPSETNVKQKEAMEAYEGKIRLFETGDTLPGEIICIDAKGHTPGHTAYQKENILIIGDLVHGAALQFAYPEFCASFDMDKDNAIESRKRLIKYAEDNELTIAGMHLPAPGFRK